MQGVRLNTAVTVDTLPWHDNGPQPVFPITGIELMCTAGAVWGKGAVFSHLCVGGRLPTQSCGMSICVPSAAATCLDCLHVCAHMSSAAARHGSHCCVHNEWCLQEEYELIIPRGGPVSGNNKSLRDAGLVPSALLHFKHALKAQREPALKPELLASAQPAPS